MNFFIPREVSPEHSSRASERPRGQNDLFDSASTFQGRAGRAGCLLSAACPKPLFIRELSFRLSENGREKMNIITRSHKLTNGGFKLE